MNVIPITLAITKLDKKKYFFVAIVFLEN